jgi:hypothetical protein
MKYLLRCHLGPKCWVENTIIKTDVTETGCERRNCVEVAQYWVHWPVLEMTTLPGKQEVSWTLDDTDLCHVVGWLDGWFADLLRHMLST